MPSELTGAGDAHISADLMSRLFQLDTPESRLLRLFFWRRRLRLSGPVRNPRPVYPFERRTYRDADALFATVDRADLARAAETLAEAHLLASGATPSRSSDATRGGGRAPGDGEFFVTSRGLRWGYAVNQFCMQQAGELDGVLDYLRRPGRCARLLDVGCGSGLALRLFVQALREEGCESAATGLDIDAGALRMGPDLACLFPGSPSIAFVEGDAMHMPLPDASADILFSNLTLLYLHRDRFLDEVRRVLAPGGRVILITAGHRLFFRNLFVFLARGKPLRVAQNGVALLAGVLLATTGLQIRIAGSYLHGEGQHALRSALERRGFQTLVCRRHGSPFGIAPLLVVADRIEDSSERATADHGPTPGGAAGSGGRATYEHAAAGIAASAGARKSS